MSRALRSSVLLARPRPTATSLPSLCLRPAARYSSHDHADPHASSSDVFPEEGFNAPFWSKLAFGGIALALFLRISPSSPSSSTDEEPFLTRYIAHNLTPAADLWRKRNEKHLEMAIAAADDKLLFQEAERPKVRRMRSFEQASPNAIPVGSQADLTDLVIKSEKEDFAKQE